MIRNDENPVSCLVCYVCASNIFIELKDTNSKTYLQLNKDPDGETRLWFHCPECKKPSELPFTNNLPPLGKS